MSEELTIVIIILNALGTIALCIMHIDTMKEICKLSSRINEINSKGK